MEKRIIFKTEEGGVAIVIPAPECLQKYSIKELADKDVPAGRPYKIIDVSEIPTDRTFRNAWDIDELELTDGVGSDSNQFSEIR
jgi:hypothetical protein